MWKATELGVASWSDDFGDVAIDARGGARGIAIAIEQAVLLVCPVGDDDLPAAGEQFIREDKAGDQWHVNFPQGNSQYALRLMLTPIESCEERLILEVCVSVQTDLLDSHPKLDLQVDCNKLESLVPQDEFGKDDVIGSGSAAISTASSGGGATSVILGTHDQPFTTNHSTDMMLRLRLFGDFLEKGVIRRARPWVVIDRKDRSSDHELERIWSRLCNSPLPLA